MVNPTNTPVRFGNINPVYPALFSAFSPQKLFTALNSTITENLFFVPSGTPGVNSTQPATVKGFGVVFTDVNVANSTKIEYFGVAGNLLFNRILKVPNLDVVSMDDFIYGEPQPLQ